MIRKKAYTSELTAAQRGQVVQRVLVDGWSPAEAAALYGVRERQVMRWVAAYRRRGMTSLRTAALTEPAPRRWILQLRGSLMRLSVALLGEASATPASCVTLPYERNAPPSSRQRL